MSTLFGAPCVMTGCIRVVVKIMRPLTRIVARTT